MRRVLVIDEDLPWPTNSGKKIRTFALLRRLAKCYDITLLCYGSESKAVAVLQSAKINVHTVPPPRSRIGLSLYVTLLRNTLSRFPYSVTKHHSSRFQRRFEELLSTGRYDLIQCEWTPYAQFLPQDLDIPVILSTHNIEAQIWGRRASASNSWFAKLFFNLQAHKMESFERTAFGRFRNVAVVSSADSQVATKWGAREVWVVDNGVDFDQFKFCSYDEEMSGRMLFLGSLDWFPNQDGLVWFTSEILPRVRQMEPNATLRVVGRHAPKSLERRLRQTPGVDFVGEVENVQHEIAHASLVVVPLRIGGGTRIKILEAMAAGRAVISTSIGAEGLDVNDGVHIRIEDEIASLSKAAASLLRDNERRRALAAAARQLTVDRYSWDRSAQVLDRAWEELMTQHCSTIIE